MRRMLHHGKRVLRIGLGGLCLVLGVIMAIPFVPGPGILFILIGLGLLAVDFLWARNLQDKLKLKAKTMVDKVRRR